MVETDKRCKECKKDWTKCGTCPVMLETLNNVKMTTVKDINVTSFGYKDIKS